MEHNKPYVRNSICLLVSAALAVSAVLYAAATKKIPLESRTTSPGFGWSWDFDYERALNEHFLTLDSPINQPHAPSAAEPLVLPLNEPVPVGGIRITYRGRSASGLIILDTVIPDLDADYAYPHELSDSEARTGFVLFDHHFKLVAAGPYAIRIIQD